MGGMMPMRPPVMVSLIFSGDRKSTRLNSSHLVISYAVFCLKKKKKKRHEERLAYRLGARRLAEQEQHVRGGGSAAHLRLETTLLTQALRIGLSDGPPYPVVW